MAVLAGRPPALAQAPTGQQRDEAIRDEVVITAQADAALTAKVVEVLHNDPYVYDSHISVVTENGVVTLRGIALDLGDLHRSLILARRAAKGRRVVNRIELIPEDLDKD